MRPPRVVDTFEATKVKTGETVRLCIVENFTEYTTASDAPPRYEANPLKYLETEDGVSVRRLSKGRYELKETNDLAGGFELISSDPKAP